VLIKKKEHTVRAAFLPYKEGRFHKRAIYKCQLSIFRLGVFRTDSGITSWSLTKHFRRFAKEKGRLGVSKITDWTDCPNHPGQFVRA
jgi:hypothetical protein